MGKLVSEGKMPYRDFFYGHPPLHVYVLALVYRLFGFSILAFRLLPLFCTLLSAFFVFKIAQNRFKNAEAVLSSALFLFAYSTMFNSLFSFGIEIATFFLVLGCFFLFNRKNYFAAGIFFGLAGITKLLALVPVFVVLAILFFQNGKIFFKAATGFALIFITANCLFIIPLGLDYLIPAYNYHFIKTSSSSEKLTEYANILMLNRIIFLSPLFFLFVKEKKKASVFFAISVAYLLFLLLLKRIYGFYFSPLMPFLALTGGFFVVEFIKNIGINKRLKILLCVFLAAVLIWDLSANIMFLNKSGFTGFKPAKEMADYIKSVSDDKTMLFGDDSSIPLMALMTNKKIAMDFVDTNNQVFDTKIKDIGKTLDEIKGKDIIFIIRDSKGISGYKETTDFLNEECAFGKKFTDPFEGNFLVFKCFT